ncbi:hypothetical protein EC604_21700 [Paenibacillus amylolyticus]|uniref:Uncharacterized protein n=1 Tax=Paenibacillus amylolyticus TaxID=1451 RepID=A0A5M9WXW5_PAEAM|nr:hypothetical protein [Paenibacillus amylolyticus]KAA8786451.1 hypothetical protein EC604_21700 [Paenibacillus amylolyticus]
MSKIQRLFLIIPICFALLIVPFYSTASAAVDNSSTSKNIIQWGLDGGITFSVLVTVSSSLTYSSKVQSGAKLYTYTESNASVLSPSSYGLAGCSTTLGIRKSTKFGSQTVNLPVQGSYIVSPGTAVLGYKSNGWSYTTDSPFSVNVENYGVATPNIGKCTGGGSVTDSFRISH